MNSPLDIQVNTPSGMTTPTKPRNATIDVKATWAPKKQVIATPHVFESNTVQRTLFAPK